MSGSTKRALILVMLLVLLALFWRALAHFEILTPQKLQLWLDWVETERSVAWLLALMAVIYSTTLLVMFPLTVLVVFTGLLFGPSWGLLYATVGTLFSSVVSYWVGHYMGRDAVSRLAGKRLETVRRYLSSRGISTMVVINLLPIAPFTLTNMLAGAFNLTFSHYMLGSALGIIPGLAVVTLAGSQLRHILLSSDLQQLVMPVLIIIGCIGGLAAGLAWLKPWIKRYLNK